MLVQLSDCHVGAASDRDPAEDLRAAVRAVLALSLQPDAVLVSGDLAEHGAPAEYAVVREVLAALPMPVHVLPGNHDDRAALREAFPDAERSDRFYRWTARCGQIRVVGCDTIRPGRDDGELTPEQLGWLREQLAADPDAPTIVAMHHPPLLTGMPVFDRIGLPARDRIAVAALLDEFPGVRRVVAGHIHMAATARLGATVATTCPSTWRERPALELGGEDFRIVEQPAGFLVHALVDGELVTHVQPLSA